MDCVPHRFTIHIYFHTYLPYLGRYIVIRRESTVCPCIFQACLPRLLGQSLISLIGWMPEMRAQPLSVDPESKRGSCTRIRRERENGISNLGDQQLGGLAWRMVAAWWQRQWQRQWQWQKFRVPPGPRPGPVSPSTRLGRSCPFSSVLVRSCPPCPPWSALFPS